MRQKKYIKGDRILTIQHLCSIVLGSNGYVFYHHKPMNPGWVRSFQFGMVINDLQKGVFCEAIINPDYREPKRRE